LNFSKISHLISLCFVAGCIAACAYARQAAAPAASEATAKLASLSVTGSKRFTSDQIAAELPVKQGAMVTRADLQAAADRLNQLGTFAKAGYRFSSDPAGVHVEYQVEDAPDLPIAFDNFPWVSDEDLRSALKAAIPLYDGTAPPSGLILDEMSTALSAYLNSKAIYVKVSHNPMSDPLTDEKLVTFFSAGAEEDVKSIDFSDALANSNAAIQSRLADLIGKPYSLTNIKLFELEQVRPVYYERSLLRVTFKPPTVIAPAPTADATPSVVIHIQIDAGTQYSWGSVAWTGNSALSSAELNALATFKPGEPTNGTKIQALWIAVTDAYGHNGYLDAALAPAPAFDDSSHRVNYTVAVTEGPQYKMGNLVLSGLSLEGEKRIRTAWALAPGVVFDQTFFDQFLDSGAKNSFTGIPYQYDRVDHFLDKDPAAGIVNVMLDFK
jgi:outer membrane protein assembly factor BamA